MPQVSFKSETTCNKEFRFFYGQQIAIRKKQYRQYQVNLKTIPFTTQKTLQLIFSIIISNEALKTNLCHSIK